MGIWMSGVRGLHSEHLLLVHEVTMITGTQIQYP